MIATIKDDFEKYLSEVLDSREEILKYSTNQLALGFLMEQPPYELSRTMEPSEDWDREQVELYNECYQYIMNIRKDL